MLLAYADGSPLLIAGGPAASDIDHGSTNLPSSDPALSTPRSGLVLYLSTAPEVSWSNLPTKPLMVPLVNEIVRQGLSMIRASQKAEVGEQPTLTHAGPAARDLRDAAGRVIPLSRAGRPQQPLETAGVYTITDEAQQPIGMLAVNIDPRAGETDVQSPAAVEAWLNKSGPWSAFEPGRLGATLGSGAGGSPISGLLLLTVLGLVLLETMLARWFSHAYRAGEDGDRRIIAPSSGAGMRGRSPHAMASQEAAA
jgi:hypothetical protein